MLEKLERHEPAIKLAFRLAVIVLLALIAWRVEEAIDTADAAHDVGYHARDYAEIAAKEAERAKTLAEEARDAANGCRYR